MRENRLLNELVKDCITYKLTESEALEYIKVRSARKISVASYNRRKAHIKSNNSTNIWLNHFTRIGFVQSHIEHINRINKICDDSMRQLLVETHKSTRDERKILALKDSIMEATKLLVGLDMGSPIIAEIKAKLEQKEKQQQQQQELSDTDNNYPIPQNKKKKKRVL